MDFGNRGRNRWWTLLAVSAAQLLVVLDGTIVNIALPSAQQALGLTDANRQWAITAYALAFGGLLLIGGRISGVLGHRRAFALGLLGFAAASALGGAAENAPVLFGARALQGLFAALLAPAGLSLLTTTFTDAGDRGRAFGVFAAVGAAGSAVGLIAGGVLTEYASWRWCLYINVPVAVGAALAVRLVPQARPVGERDRPDDEGGRLDGELDRPVGEGERLDGELDRSAGERGLDGEWERPVSDRVRLGGERRRQDGVRGRPGGERGLSGGDLGRPVRERGRPGGVRARSVGEGGRVDGERVRSVGEGRRLDGERERSGGELGRPVRDRGRLDLPGAVLSATGFVALVCAFTEAEARGWGSPVVVALLAFGGLLLAGFVAVERRAPRPLLPMRVLADPARASAFLAVTLLFVAMFGFYLFMSYHTQAELGYSPVEAGLVLIINATAALAGSMLIAGRLLGRVPPVVLIVPGLLTAAAGIGVLVWFSALVPALVLTGLGLGCVLPPTASLATAGTRGHDIGAASAAYNASQQLGAALGVALLNTIAVSATTTAGLTVAVGILLVAACVTGPLLTVASRRSLKDRAARTGAP
ncbi:MFS transporter [Amycolatopsis albispora]|uniref:MFS transporter n=1 Tax=Amycolatopsis albispora TaxID=1804986 RepID=UPI001EFF9209|nr:MFS transporter [Amycolatopsis albispora]